LKFEIFSRLYNIKKNLSSIWYNRKIKENENFNVYKVRKKYMKVKEEILLSAQALELVFLSKLNVENSYIHATRINISIINYLKCKVS